VGGSVIDGILVTVLKRIAHAKGDVLHGIKCSDAGFVGFGEAYFSTVIGAQVKGWKRHRRVTLNLVVPVGRIRFVLHDDRDGSATCGQFQEVTLGDSLYARLTVPPNLWLAFQGAHSQPSLLLNVIDEEHDPAEGDAIPLSHFEYAW